MRCGIPSFLALPAFLALPPFPLFHLFRRFGRELIFTVNCICGRIRVHNEARAKAVLLFLLVPCGGWAQEWRFYGGDSGGTRFSSLQQINRQNVSALKRAWTYHTGEVNRENETDRHQVAPFETTPLVVDGMLYLSTPSNRVIALDAETGKEDLAV